MRTARFCLLSTLVMLAAGGFTNARQQDLPPVAEPISDTLRVDVDLVTIGVRVTDNKGREASGLREQDFLIFEDGKLQQLADFAAEQQPVSVLVLLERSFSMLRHGQLDEAKRALNFLGDQGHPENEYALMVFDDQPALLVDFVQDWQPIEAALEKLRPQRSGSSLYDSLSIALDHLAQANHPRQALLFITDGADQNSRLNFNDVLERLEVSRSQVHVIGLFDPKEDEVFRSSDRTVTLVSGREIDNPRYAFRRLAEQSGAERYFPRSADELHAAMRTIVNDLRTQYTVGYYTSAADQDSRYRRIEVKVRPRGLLVRAQHGFSLPAGEKTEAPLLQQSLAPASEVMNRRVIPYELKTRRIGAQVVYSEDFSDGASGWPQKPGFSLKSGQYHLESGRPATIDDGLVAANGPLLGDFKASVIVGWVRSPRRPGSASPAAGLVFRLNDRGYYAFLISPVDGPSIQYKLVRTDFDSPVTRDLLPWQQATIPGPAGISLHKLEVVCEGRSIRLLVNGVQLQELNDASFAEGLVGAVLFGEGHAVFDDLLAQSTTAAKAF